MPSGYRVGEPLVLDEFQKEFVVEVYGPVNDRGLRRIRRALLSIARKNGKSAFAAGLVLVHLVGPEAIRNGDCLSAATDREQAGHIYKMVKQVIALDEELSALCRCIDSLKRVVCYHNGNFYQSLSADARRQHGGNPVFCIYDELAQALDREMYDVLSTSFGAREEALFLTISTQSSDPQSVMTELCDEAIAQEAGTLDDPYFYGKVYAAPDGANIYDEENWKLANPALGTFRSLDDMRALATKAKRSPSAEAGFRNLNLNQRVDGVQALVNSRDWAACAHVFTREELEALRHAPAYGALDLSNRVDLSAFTLCWVLEKGARIMTRSWFWTHEGDLAERSRKDGAKYPEWNDAGWLSVLPGRSISYKPVVLDLARITAGLNLQAIAFDRYRIDDLKRELEYEGIDERSMKLIEYGQGYKDMTTAVEALETGVLEHTLQHDGNPITTYCLSNVRVMRDPAGNRKFDKRDPTRRIDGAVTLGMALGTIAKAEREEKAPPSVYLTRGLLAV